MKKLQLKDLPLKGKRVLVRVDFNVPLNGKQKITDDTRIRAALPTIQYILDQGGLPILMSHLGRPQGKVDPHLSLAPCAKRLEELIGVPVTLAPNCVGPDVNQLAQKMQPHSILLLENLRFHEGETKPEINPEFAKQLAQLGEVYVNDAFGTAHRAHSSTVLGQKYFPKCSAAGFLLQKEIDFLGQKIVHPERPFIAIIGGAKVSSKLGVLEKLIKKADLLLIGGGMAFTFLKAMGKEVGNSLVEEELLPIAHKLLEQNDRIELPIDVRIAQKMDAQTPTKLAEREIPQGWMGLDVGPKTLENWKKFLQKAKTILWNGPLGVFEIPPFAKGTLEMAKILAQSSATTIVGGGDSVAAVNQAGMSTRIDHISTGGGAALEYIEKGVLPGIEALTSI